MQESIIVRDPWETEPRVAELHLGPVARLLRVASIAMTAGSLPYTARPSLHSSSRCCRRECGLRDDGRLQLAIQKSWASCQLFLDMLRFPG